MIGLGDRHRHILIEFIKFGTVGAVGFGFDNALVYFGIYILGFSRDIAGLFSFPFVVTLTWAGNRFFTFRESRRDRLSTQLLKFMSVCAVGLLFNRGTYSLMTHNVPLAYDYPVLGLLAGTAVGMFFNFFVIRKLVFNKI